MRSSGFKILAVCTLCALFLIPMGVAFELGDTTPNWSMWEGWEEINYGLYDYQGKIVLVNLFATW
jgi:hypothetical protein